jgi:hypothetical protein
MFSSPVRGRSVFTGCPTRSGPCSITTATAAPPPPAPGTGRGPAHEGLTLLDEATVRVARLTFRILTRDASRPGRSSRPPA